MLHVINVFVVGGGVGVGDVVAASAGAADDHSMVFASEEFNDYIITVICGCTSVETQCNNKQTSTGKTERKKQANTQASKQITNCHSICVLLTVAEKQTLRLIVGDGCWRCF